MIQTTRLCRLRRHDHDPQPAAGSLARSTARTRNRSMKLDAQALTAANQDQTGCPQVHRQRLRWRESLPGERKVHLGPHAEWRCRCGGQTMLRVCRANRQGARSLVHIARRRHLGSPPELDRRCRPDRCTMKTRGARCFMVQRSVSPIKTRRDKSYK